MIKEVDCEIGTVAVRDGYHILQGVPKTLLQYFCGTSRGPEAEGDVHGLSYPCPVKFLVVVASRLVKAHHP